MSWRGRPSGAGPSRKYVNWLTHAKNAVRMDAEIGLKAVEHLLGMFTATRLRMGWTNHRCQECGSYELVARVCRQCEWADPFYEVPKMRERSNEELEGRLAEPCTPKLGYLDAHGARGLQAGITS